MVPAAPAAVVDDHRHSEDGGKLVADGTGKNVVRSAWREGYHQGDIAAGPALSISEVRHEHPAGDAACHQQQPASVHIAGFFPTSGPIPKFASIRGTFRCELRI